tara:strand:- start:119777 stop:120322 length:546 start_codon:yes stop_codon:yes gene_type:complete
VGGVLSSIASSGGRRRPIPTLSFRRVCEGDAFVKAEDAEAALSSASEGTDGSGSLEEASLGGVPGIGGKGLLGRGGRGGGVRGEVSVVELPGTALSAAEEGTSGNGRLGGLLEAASAVDSSGRRGLGGGGVLGKTVFLTLSAPSTRRALARPVCLGLPALFSSVFLEPSSDITSPNICTMC